MAMQLSGDQSTQLRDYFAAQPEVELAYLFGSFAEGRAVETSDVDIGVVTTEPLGFRRQVEMVDRLEAIVGHKVDLVQMKAAPIDLRCTIIAARHRLYERDTETYVEFEAQTMSLYTDAEPTLRWQREQILKGEHRERAVERSRKALRAALERRRLNERPGEAAGQPGNRTVL